MLLVMIIFVLGGNIYMLFCESWRNQQLFQVSLLWGDNPAWSLWCLNEGCWWSRGSTGHLGCSSKVSCHALCLVSPSLSLLLAPGHPWPDP